MNRTLMLVGLTGAMAAASAMPAMAINKEWSAALGFIGGVLATRTYDYNHSYRGYGGGGCGPRPYYVQQPCPPPVYVQPCPPPTVVVQQQPVYVQQPSGHYEIRQEQQWVEGVWKYEQVGCNTYRKVWCPGYYRSVEVKVWVQN